MAVAESAPPRATPEVPPRRRRLTGRLSAGHVVMITAALLAMIVNYSVLRASDDTVRVAVAGRDLRAGAPVAADALRFTDVRVDEELLATLVEPDAVARLDGFIASTAVAEGDLLRRGDLREPSAPAAQRAMSIPIEPEHAVAGALEVGDRIDVIEVRDEVATYLLVDAPVLDVPAVEPVGGLASLRSFSVTVAVDDRTALRLAAAIRGGELELVRSTGAAPADASWHDASPSEASEAADRADTFTGDDE